LTSNITPKSEISADPQAWLDGLSLDGLALDVHFSNIVTTGAFFKKLVLRCDKQRDVLELALRCRAYGVVENGDRAVAQTWLNEDYDPHCSLL